MANIKYIQHYTFPGDFEAISIYCASQEYTIITEVPWQSDYGTKLNNSSVSTRSGAYNIFDDKHIGKCQDLQDLLIFIRDSYSHYILNVLPRKNFENNTLTPSMMAWVNVLRTNEAIGCHKHSDEYYAGLWSFVSGTMCLAAAGTKTHYKYSQTTNDGVCWGSPDGEVFGQEEVDNIPGRLTIFPPYYEHWTTVNESNPPLGDLNKRVTLGFDILFHKSHAPDNDVFTNNLIDLPDYNLMSNS